MSSSAAHLACTICQRQEAANTRLWRCPCGGPFQVVANTFPSFETTEPARGGLWRYRQALPIDSDAAIVTLGEGMTPLVDAAVDSFPVQLKCEFCNPTGSYKDRGWTVAVSHLKEQGVDAVIEDSSGNAGASLAAYGARAGIDVEVFVPDDAPAGKKRQIVAHGARIREIPGGREAVAAACLKAAAATFYAGHAWNPWFLQGTRTLAWELFEQGGGKPPAAVVTPVGQGGILLGLQQGFSALVEAGMLKAVPPLVAVQAAACAPVVTGLARQHPQPPAVTPQPTRADGIRTPAPVRYREVIEALRASGGTALAVDEDEIERARVDLAGAGFFVEPTSAVAAAGAQRWLAAGGSTADGPVVIILTGHGLKAAG